MRNERDDFYRERYLKDAVFKHGWPADQWDYLQLIKALLSTRMPFDEWSEITHGRVPDLTLGHYMAARHVVLSLPIPGRIKDAVTIDAPVWVREVLNRWNRDTAHLKYSYGFGDIRGKEPMEAIACAGSHLYLPYKRNSGEIEELALVIFDMACDFGPMEQTEQMT